jgi:hypothetical protein
MPRRGHHQRRVLGPRARAHGAHAQVGDTGASLAQLASQLHAEQKARKRHEREADGDER